MLKFTLVFSPLCRFTSMPTTTTNPPHCTAPRSIMSHSDTGTPPRAYSKMFVGGLSWDTTDGTLSLLILPPFVAMTCPFTNSLSCTAVAACNAFLLLLSPMLFITRRLAELLFGIRHGRRMYHRSRRRRQVTRVCVPHLRGPTLGQRSHDRERSLDGKAVRDPTIHLSVFEKVL